MPQTSDVRIMFEYSAVKRQAEKFYAFYSIVMTAPEQTHSLNNTTVLSVGQGSEGEILTDRIDKLDQVITSKAIEVKIIGDKYPMTGEIHPWLKDIHNTQLSVRALEAGQEVTIQR